MARPNNINMAPGGGGGRSSGGITGPGGKSVTPIYKQSIPPATVKVVPKGTQPLTQKPSGKFQAGSSDKHKWPRA